WRSLLDGMSIWRVEPQHALAASIRESAPSADRALTYLHLLGRLHTAGNSLTITEELTSAVVTACHGAGVTGTLLRGVASGDWRLGLAAVVAQAGLDALAQPDTGRDGATARDRFDERTEPVLRVHEDGEVVTDLTGLGELLWVPLGSRPEDAA